ncbi:MAG: hypothetical protein GY896_09725 [Gammaproteobacteria bacterium]|nr:hypothetical protein [Gammaproteobacteria bacterium]
MKLSTRIVTAVLLIAGSSGVVYAFSKHNDWGMSPDEKVEFVTERVTKKLELDAQQQQNFSQLAETVVQIMIDVKATKAQHMSEIKTLLDEPNFNQARALDLIQQKTQMVNEKAPQVIAALSIFLDSLDSGQKQQLQEFFQRHHEHHGKHHRHDED